MSEERIQEIKDSINFQYELIVSKGIDKSALLFTKEEQELLEEVERLNKSLEEQRHFYLKKLEQKDNIIREIEDMLENPWNIDCINQNNNYLHKLQELKGSE